MRWRPHTVILYAFDLMHLNGRDLRQQPLSERRAILKTLIGTDNESRIQFSEGFQGDSAAFFNACADKGLEGIVSKTRHLSHIARAAAILGSRPSASLNPVLSLSAQIATARPGRSGLCSRTLTARACVMPGQHLSLLVMMREQSFSLRWSASPRLGLRLIPHGSAMLSGANLS